MKKIKIKLNEKYKSFEADFETELEGDLIILSGVNGSGKSQLMNIINGAENGDSRLGYQRLNLDRTIEINGVQINTKNIEFRSYKDNITIPEIIKTSSTTINSAIDQAYQHYKDHGLLIEAYPVYTSSYEQTIKLLGSLYVKGKRDLPEDIFKSTLRGHKLVWKQDDQFTDIIGDIFYRHASEITNGQQKSGMVDGPAFNPLSLGIAPWNELNELFTILKLEYRFREDYQIKYSELTEAPVLFQIDSNGKIIENERRLLKDLSDGEKTIISLCFTSLSKIDNEEKKIILLDEFDAVLNPSLIENFFTVIKKYFLDNGIIVIITTHSSATISLAPEYTSYYEVFKKQVTATRVFKIDRDQYLELQKVNKRFYDKIENQAERIKELESSFESDQNILIITEGKTDWKYILKALQYFHNKEEFKEIDADYFYKFGSKDDVENNVCGTIFFADLGESQLNSSLLNEINLRTTDKLRRKKIRIGIFDSDTDIKTKAKIEYGVHSFKIQPNGISTEFLFTEEIIKTEVNGERLFTGLEFNERTGIHKEQQLTLGVNSSKRAGKKEIIDTDVYDITGLNKTLSKEKFAQAIFSGHIEIPEKSWENFRHIFEKITDCLPVKIVETEIAEKVN
jgi:ABC-type multidrug transport system ATPase subunit